MRNSLAVRVALWFCVLLTPALAHEELVFEHAQQGLRVRRPSAEWAWYSSGPTGDALYAVAFFPRGSQGMPGWTLYVSAAGGATDPEVALEPAKRKLATLGATEFERTTTRVAGRDAPTLRTTLELPNGVAVELRATFVIANDRLYATQAVRAQDDEAARAPLEALSASLELFEPVADARAEPDAALARLAARCGEELGWAGSWKDASERAAKEKKLVLVLVENYAALGVPSTARSGPFVDSDFAPLVAAHCVPWAMGVHDDAPFRAPSAYGISKSAWGTALLFVEPDGDVIAEAASSNATYLDAFFRATVLPKLAPDPDSVGPTGLARAERALARGDFARAEKLLGGERSPEALRVRATIARRERRADDALALLREAAENAAPELAPELAADRALVELRDAKLADSKASWQRVLREWPEHPRAAQALFWLGALRVLEPDDELAPEEWRRLVAERPDSPWAAKAAANLALAGAFVHGAERPDWPEPELLAATLPIARSPLGASARVRARDDALAWLVKHQRDDGAWWVPMDGYGVGSNLYSTATTALAATALLPHVAEPGARAAVERGLAHVLANLDAGALDPASDLAGAYGVWNRAFAAWLVARSLAAEFGDRERLQHALARLVPALEASQHRGGGYPYVFFPGDPAGEGLDPSASFLTAGVAFVLADARAAGAEVSEQRLARTLDFLESMRDPDGTFRYMRDVAVERSGGVAREACGRGPVCVLALQRNGRSDAEELRRVLELFVAGRDVYAPEWGKALCHTSPTGFGAHYLLYDYVFACVALGLPSELDATERKRFRAVLLEDLLAQRLADGSFQDLPGLGRAYGTAAALLALDALAER